MSDIRTIFWDIGGVLLSNGWDSDCRRAAAAHFGLDAQELEIHHNLLSQALDLGHVTLREYVARAVFYTPRPFSVESFVDFVFSCSRPHSETLDIAERISRSRRYLVCALNNEGSDLNQYRIERFVLRKFITLFFSSCFLGVRKPTHKIYRRALQITQQPPHHCLYIEDRQVNVEAACELGIHAIHYRNPTQLREQLERFGVR